MTHPETGPFSRAINVSKAADVPFPIRVLFNPVNQGYGGNQKIGYHYAIEHGFDFVALLHGDGQYAPEMPARLLDPLAKAMLRPSSAPACSSHGRPKGRDAAVQVRGQPDADLDREQLLRLQPQRVSLRLPGLLRATRSPQFPSSGIPTTFTSTPRSSFSSIAPRRGSRSCRSRPTTAMRSATSTA